MSFRKRIQQDDVYTGSSMNRYKLDETWRQNLENAPPAEGDRETLPAMPGEWSWCGLKLNSPLGIPAGPLLDSRWLLYYANLGFDWLVYKTVRTREHPCHPLPNLVHVDSGQLCKTGQTLPATSASSSTWAVSFGMPSQSPSVWRADVERARDRLQADRKLIVSVVATQDVAIQDPQASLSQIADDFALAARWAMESGADGIVANFSCPNVNTADGQLYQQPDASRFVAAAIRQAIGATPLALKIGFVSDVAAAEQLVMAVAGIVDGLVMTNSIPARVIDPTGKAMFDGQSRGICGAAIRDASVRQVQLFRRIVEVQDTKLDLIGVGGVQRREDVDAYLAAGAQCVGLATAAMLDPRVALDIRGSWG